ncbi:uncharacterized protein LOC100116515 isoform X2 [Nasonia vitripennis]|nr:uncharacterized protein LOC100116515 isoform X2 [Nasonia vitripennis]
MWTKFTNHTNDHPLFSYAVQGQPRAILSWIANTERSSYYMMSVDGHNLYRLNYPLQLNKWYHSCQSWNGHTGEWQIWINDERVGRGFNNRLVGHIIKGGGVAISGQEQGQLDQGLLKSDLLATVTIGMLGELTMLQLYHVALTAGKAHRDHKHHHAHHFEHNSDNHLLSSTKTQVPVTGPPLPINPYITGGQINHQVKLNPGAHIQIIQNGVTLRHPNTPSAAKVPQPLPLAIQPALATTEHSLTSSQPKLSYNFVKTLIDIGGSNIPSRSDVPVSEYSFVNRQYRHTFATKPVLFSEQIVTYPQPESQLNGRVNEDINQMDKLVELKKITKRSTLNKSIKKVNPIVSPVETLMDKKKRGIVFVDGSKVDESYLYQRPQLLTNDDNTNFFAGLRSYGIIPTETDVDLRTSNQEEREPAEEEVRRVMNICNGCIKEPFERALAMSWRRVPKKIYSGALHVPADQNCKAF